MVSKGGLNMKTEWTADEVHEVETREAIASGNAALFKNALELIANGDNLDDSPRMYLTRGGMMELAKKALAQEIKG
jgi:O-acetylhomoserine/O-acetylserine sulfhydrylase-like pyridoxal-dependent enzyme